MRRALTAFMLGLAFAVASIDVDAADASAAGQWPVMPSKASQPRATPKPKPGQRQAKPGKPKPKARPKERCSATGVNVHPIIPFKVPKNVQRMHQRILEAAADCDFAQLERLALEGRQHFDFTFGNEKKPGAYWRGLEKKGQPFLARLIKVMKLDFGRDGKVYVWPGAAARSAAEEDWEALVPLFGEHQMIVFRDYGGYTDVRLAIVDDGDWIYCVDGD